MVLPTAPAAAYLLVGVTRWLKRMPERNRNGALTREQTNIGNASLNKAVRP